MAWWYREDRYDGTFEAFSESYPTPATRRYLLPAPEVVIPARATGGSGFSEVRRRLARRHPEVLLRELADGPGALEAPVAAVEGGWTVRGRLADGTPVSLDLDGERGLRRGVSYRTSIPGRGVKTATWWFDDYRAGPHGGLVPHRYGSTVGALRYTEMRVDSLGTDASPWIDAPPEWTVVPEREVEDPVAVRDPAPLALETLAPGVHRVPEVRSGFAPLVVEVSDGLLVVDAPASFPLPGQIPAGETDPGPSASWAAERLVDLLGERFPEQPVRWLAFTHGHEDHLAGVRTFVAAGATVLAADTLRPAIEAIVALPGDEVPDRLAESPDRPPPRAGRPLRVRRGDPRAPEALSRRDARPPRRVPRGVAGRSGLAPARIWAMHGAGEITPAHLAKLGG